MIERLFVYGTLAPGRPNEHLLKSVEGSWERAKVVGWLRNEGWGAAQGYPGIVLGQGGQDVEGFLFTSTKLSQHWPILDAFEGDAYHRVATKAVLENGDAVDAYVYALS